MSASNYAVCPKCVANATRDYHAAVDAAAAVYGKVPKEEYEALRDKATALTFDPESFRTLREDWEIYGAAKGNVTVSYGCGCETA